MKCTMNKVWVPGTHLVSQLGVGWCRTQVVDDAGEAVPDRYMQRCLSVLHQHKAQTRNGEGIRAADASVYRAVPKWVDGCMNKW